MDNKMTRIGVFYDGNYFSKVNQYYNYVHARRTSLNITGLHNFIREKVAKEEQEDKKFCQIVEAHYFRGRRSAKQATAEQLQSERFFDDILSREGVIPHYLPLRSNGISEYEKGIDVWLALEAFEHAHQNRFNVLVLIAGDGDYLPLIRKINALGIRVLLLSWNFEYTTLSGDVRYTSTSEALLREATYPYAMSEVIDSVASKYDPIINGLFVTKNERNHSSYTRPATLSTPMQGENEDETFVSTSNTNLETSIAPIATSTDVVTEISTTKNNTPTKPSDMGVKSYVDHSLGVPSGPDYLSAHAQKVQVNVADTFEGTILYYNEEKSYGFIEHPQYPNNLYFHYRDIIADREEEKYFLKGDKVQFKIKLNPLAQYSSEFVAFDVELLEEAPQSGNMN